MYKVLISGYYGFNNIGDEAVLTSVIRTIRKQIPDAEITVLSNDPEDTKSRYRVDAVYRMAPLRIIECIRKSDLVVSGGGGLLQDATSRRSILYYLSIIQMAISYKKPVYFFPQGIGPVHSKLNRCLVKSCLKKVSYIAVRDQASKRLLVEIGIDEAKVDVSADMVLRNEKTRIDIGKECLSAAGCDTSRPIIGFAIRSVPDKIKAEFLAGIASCIKYVQNGCGAQCVLIPFYYEQDIQINQELAGMCDGVYIIQDKKLSEEMFSIIGNLDCIIGMRLHSLIGAAVMGVPMLGISYDNKVDAFLNSLGERILCKQEEISLQVFKEGFDSLMMRKEQHIESVSRHLDLIKQRFSLGDRILSEIYEKTSD